MTELFSIRLATTADAPIIIAHRRAMFEAMGVGSRADLDAMDVAFADWLADRLACGEYRGWFATNECGEVIAGAGVWLVAWAPTPRDQAALWGYVMNVYTHSDYRRQVLARRLMRAVMDWCRGHNVHTLFLKASDTGRPLYESLGFRQTNEMRIQI